MIETQTADLPGAVLDHQHQILVALELRHEVDRRVLPPIDLALRERRRGGRGVLHEIPYDAVDIDHLGTGAEARAAGSPRDVVEIFFEDNALTGDPFGRNEFEGSRADRSLTCSKALVCANRSGMIEQ